MMAKDTKKVNGFTFNSYRAVGVAEGFEPSSGKEEELAAWQYLVNTGLAYRLQGWFGRTAEALIEGGHITRPKGGAK